MTTVLQPREQVPEAEGGLQEKPNLAPRAPADVPGARPSSVGNEQTGNQPTDNPHEAYGPVSLRGLGRGGFPALWTGSLGWPVALHLTAGGCVYFQHPCNSVCLSSAKYNFLADAVKTEGGRSIPLSSVLSPFSVH